MAQPIATHYDNLKVRRDAPLDVIKTSYRKLSQKYHPDRNPDPAALETMKLINQAWDVLSDPERRARHDRAIEELERRSATQAVASAPRQPATAARPDFSAPAPAAPQRNRAAPRRPARQTNKLVVVVSLVVAFLLFLRGISGLRGAWPDDSDDAGQIIHAPTPVYTAPVVLQPQSDRVEHGYLMSVVQDNTPGIAVVEIDNLAGMADAEVRLFRNERAARSLFVHQGEKFVIENLAPGSYIIKYRSVINGQVIAYQVRQPFFAHKENFVKLKLTLFDATAERIFPDQF